MKCKYADCTDYEIVSYPMCDCGACVFMVAIDSIGCKCNRKEFTHLSLAMATFLIGMVAVGVTGTDSWKAICEI